MDKGYTVTGVGFGEAELVYVEPTLEQAGYLAGKMADNGVRDARIFDEAGNQIPLNVAFVAYLKNVRG